MILIVGIKHTVKGITYFQLLIALTKSIKIKHSIATNSHIKQPQANFNAMKKHLISHNLRKGNNY
jgi:hypothetical protein